MERGNWKPNIETSPACPRCGSSNTKFCYYNNYSLTQPRYFCKSCRRYWTKGGSLRNVPVGGGCRKSRRPRSSRAAPHPTPTNHTSRIQTSSSTPSTPIDLATVYANFLNQPPPPPTAAEIVIPPHMNQLGSYLPENNGFFECGSFLGGGGSDSSVFGGFPTAAAEGFGGGNALPPLPEAAAVMWPSSEMLLPLGQGMIGREVEPVQENLNGLNLEAIFRS